VRAQRHEQRVDVRDLVVRERRAHLAPPQPEQDPALIGLGLRRGRREGRRREREPARPQRGTS
jgi:hypothetical protein